jgi:hypothetical protein
MLLLGSAAVLLTSCLKRVDYPDRPDINLTSVTIFSPPPDTITNPIGRVDFTFTDGDGDLGFRPGDTLDQFALYQPFYYNLVVNYFEMDSGEYVMDTAVSKLSSARFISLTPEGADKTLEGDMEVGIFGLPPDTIPFDDTVRYEIHIADRALHRSDTIVVDLIK